MHPKVACIGIDGLAYRFVKSQLQELPTFHRLFIMGTGGKLSYDEPKPTCLSWLDFLTYRTPPKNPPKGRQPRSGGNGKPGSGRTPGNRREKFLWDLMAKAGVTVSIVNVPMPVEAGSILGVLEPRPCPFMLRQAYTRPEDVLMLAEDNLRHTIDICQSEASDVLICGLPPIDLIGRGPRSERETLFVAYKAIDAIVGRLINALEPQYLLVFSPFATRRRTRLKPGGPSGEKGLWAVGGEEIPRGKEIHAHIKELPALLVQLLDIPLPGRRRARDKTLLDKVNSQLIAMEV